MSCVLKGLSLILNTAKKKSFYKIINMENNTTMQYLTVKSRVYKFLSIKLGAKLHVLQCLKHTHFHRLGRERVGYCVCEVAQV